MDEHADDRGLPRAGQPTHPRVADDRLGPLAYVVAVALLVAAMVLIGFIGIGTTFYLDLSGQTCEWNQDEFDRAAEELQASLPGAPEYGGSSCDSVPMPATGGFSTQASHLEVVSALQERSCRKLDETDAEWDAYDNDQWSCRVDDVTVLVSLSPPEPDSPGQRASMRML